MTKAWLGDGLVDVDSSDAAVSILDRGLTVGDGVFETLKVVRGVPFALTRHLVRLGRSAAALAIDLPPDDTLREAIAAVIAANADEVEQVGRLRLTVTHGPGVLGDPYAGGGVPTVFATVVPQHPWGPTAAVALSPYRRNERSALTGVKSTSYAENAVALRVAKADGADEALLLNTAGQVCEGTGSNIFMVLDGRLVTPNLGSGCLDGVTRQLVVQWCGAAEVPVPAEALDACNEAFLTSSTRDVHPVGRLGDRQLPAPGPVTAVAMATWREREAADLDP